MMAAWDKELEEHYWNRRIMSGAIPICHRGCALRQWLVVNGNHKGYVWNDDRADHAGVYPLLLADGKPATFTTWYWTWLGSAGTQPIDKNDGQPRSTNYFSEWVVLGAMAFGVVAGIAVARWNGLSGPYTLCIVVGTAVVFRAFIAVLDYARKSLRRIKEMTNEND
jgi:hypothetical protein